MYSIKIQKRITKKGQRQYSLNLPIEVARRLKLDKKDVLHIEDIDKKVIILSTSKRRLKQEMELYSE